MGYGVGATDFLCIRPAVYTIPLSAKDLSILGIGPPEAKIELIGPRS